MLQRVEAVQVAREDLQRDQHRASVTPVRRLAASSARSPRQQCQRKAEARDQEGHRQAGRQQHVHHAIRHRRREQDLPSQSVAWHHAVAYLVPTGVCIQEFSTRIQNADIVVPNATREGGERMHAVGHAADAEQHDR